MKRLALAALAFISLAFAEDVKDITRHFDLRQPTCLTAQDLDNHLGGVLKGKGEQFKKAEEKYKVNALFLVAVAIFESGNGTSNRAKTKFNCFGLKGKSFKNIDDCIDYTAMILSSDDGYYYGRKKYTIEKVGKTYAPISDNKGNARWIPAVVSIMKKIHNMVEKS